MGNGVKWKEGAIAPYRLKWRHLLLLINFDVTYSTTVCNEYRIKNLFPMIPDTASFCR